MPGIKGQISIDFILAIAIVLLILAILSSTNTGVSQAFAEESVAFQEKAIAELIQENVFLAASNKPLASPGNSLVEFFVPPIINPVTFEKHSCVITLAGSDLNIFYDLNGVDFNSVGVEFIKTDFVTASHFGLTMSSLSCNQMVTIT